LAGLVARMGHENCIKTVGRIPNGGEHSKYLCVDGNIILK